MSIGNRIRESRKQKKMTQESLAKATGLSQMSVRRYETDDRMPPADIAAEIARVLDVDANFLLYGDITPFMKENAVPPSDTDTMSPEEIAALREKNERAAKRHIQITEEREGFMRAYDYLNDRGKGKIHGYLEGLVEQPQYLMPGVKPLVREDRKE